MAGISCGGSMMTHGAATGQANLGAGGMTGGLAGRDDFGRLRARSDRHPEPEAQMSVIVRMLGPEDATVLDRVATHVFDGPVKADLVREFLHDPRHHIAVAI